MSAGLLFPELAPAVTPARTYSRVLTVQMNGKGVLDCDTVKGCTSGMAVYPDGGCYGECYAAKGATRSGIDFSVSVSRKLMDREHIATVIHEMRKHSVGWYRVGVAGDPCHDWDGTMSSLRVLRYAGKTPVVITKHWRPLEDRHIEFDRRREAGVPAQWCSFSWAV